MCAPEATTTPSSCSSLGDGRLGPSSASSPTGAPVTTSSTDRSVPTAPPRSGAVIATLIGVAMVANLNLSVANVALPEIALHFDASQVGINLVAVGFSLGLAASVLWLGAVGDRYGRRRMLLIGTALAVPASMLAAWAPTVEVLIGARILGGLAAGMAFPTTLSLITALWSGPPRTRMIAVWSGVGGASQALGPLSAGALLTHVWWGSVFLLTVPLAVLAFLAAARYVPAHVNEGTEPVDNLGGILSVVMVGAIVLSINFAPESAMRTQAVVTGVIGLLTAVAFVLRQRRVRGPLYDLHIAARRMFWVAAVGGMLVFGALMGAMYVGQQYLQDVLGYSTWTAGLSILPAAVVMVAVAPHSATIVDRFGSRAALLAGYVFCGAGFVVMLVLWDASTSFAVVALGYVFLGIGVAIAGTPASRALTCSVPVRRAGMASGTADLQRDLGGAVMQSVLGALLTAGYATSFRNAIAASPEADSVSDQVSGALTKSFAGAEGVAARFPQYATEITAAARDSFVAGQHAAFLVGFGVMVLGILLAAFGFPDREEEHTMLAAYAEADAD
ncbi:MAG: MFS transporter [Acidobacteria bacterium]|nr:MFS transporter [Acidobacteriota bacterium]